MSYTPDCEDCPTPEDCKAKNNCQVTQQIRHGNVWGVPRKGESSGSDKHAGVPDDDEIKAALVAYEGAVYDDDSDEETIEPARDALLDVLRRCREAARSAPSAASSNDDHAEVLRGVIAAAVNGRCYACGWPFDTKPDPSGCTLGDCSYRPSEQHPDYPGWHKRFTEMLAAQTAASVARSSELRSDLSIELQKRARPFHEEIAKLRDAVPPEEWDKLPRSPVPTRDSVKAILADYDDDKIDSNEVADRLANVSHATSSVELPPVYGVRRDGYDAIIKFERPPTDDQMDALQEILSGRAPASATRKSE